VQATSDSAYPDESVVVEHLDMVVNYAPDGTGWKERTFAARLQSDSAVKKYGVVTVPYASNSESVAILYARVRHPDGTINETQPSDAIEMTDPVTREAPLYSDLKEKHLPIRSLRVGDTLEWKARITRTKAEAPGQFWGQESFTDDAVVLSQTLELRIALGTYVNVWSPTAMPTETTTDGQHNYRWTTSQLKPTAGKEAEAAVEAKKKILWTADQELDADHGKLPSVAWTTFKSWEAVGAWYRSLEADRIYPDAAIKAKVAELTDGKSTDDEKTRALYDYVATNIRYIGVDFGIGRYQPHTSSEILANQYGDCKDKHTLLAAMLDVIGLRAYAVLIGAGIRFNEAVPSPASFNHLITRVTIAGQPIWLDTTTEVAPYRLLVYPIRDKQALVVPESGVSRLDRTPVDPPFASFQNMDAVGTLDRNGASKSHLVLTVRGDEEVIFRTAFRQLTPAQYDQAAQRFSEAIGFGETTSNAEVSRPADTAQPFTFAYDYKSEKGAEWDNFKIIPQLAPISLPQPDDKDPPVRSILLGAPRIESSTSALKLPAGWGAVLPDSVHAKSIYATYDITYRFDQGTVYVERRIEILKDKVPFNDWNTYKKWIIAAKLDESSIQLTRTAAPTAPKAEATKPDLPPDFASSQATNLIQSALKSIDAKDLDGAKNQLDQAFALNPDQQFYWEALGTLMLKRGQNAEALAAFRKELALHPDEPLVYRNIFDTLFVLRQRKEAMETLHDWALAEPDDPLPVSKLIALLVEDGDTATAIKEGKAALAGLPEDLRHEDRLQIELGRAQILSGNKTEGSASLRAVLAHAEDIATINNAAYVLADAGLDLPIAEKSIRSALARLTTESNTWTLDGDSRTMRAQSTLILSAWDTLGWTLFREGKLDEAHTYLNAAWLWQVSPEYGEHLADLEAARGDKVAALTAYELTLAIVLPVDNLAERKALAVNVKNVQAKADALRKAGATSGIVDPSQELLSIRTIQLGSHVGRNQIVNYRILLKDGNVEMAEPVANRSIDGGSEMITKANFARYFPAGTHVQLVRMGQVTCHLGACELLLGQ
jgi:tetratricopeptide (TPR) repeat protein